MGAPRVCNAPHRRLPGRLAHTPPPPSAPQAADLRAALGLLPPRGARGGGAGGGGAGGGGEGLDARATTVFRLVNSEGDRLSGVVADQLGDVVVVQARARARGLRVASALCVRRVRGAHPACVCARVCVVCLLRPNAPILSPAQSCAAWAERYREAITAAITRHSGAARVVWRRATSILAEEGVADLDGPGGADLGLSAASSTEEGGGEGPGSSVDSDAGGAADAALAGGGGGGGREGAVLVREGGVAFLASPETGQKTGVRRALLRRALLGPLPGARRTQRPQALVITETNAPRNTRNRPPSRFLRGPARQPRVHRVPRDRQGRARPVLLLGRVRARRRGRGRGERGWCGGRANRARALRGAAAAPQRGRGAGLVARARTPAPSPATPFRC